VKARRRLVEEDQLRIADEGKPEVEPAPLATREPPGSGIALLLEADQPDHFVDRSWVLVVARELREMLGNCEVLVHGRGLEHNADPPSPVEIRSRRIVPEHLHLTCIALSVPLEDLDRRRLAG